MVIFAECWKAVDVDELDFLGEATAWEYLTNTLTKSLSVCWSGCWRWEQCIKSPRIKCTCKDWWWRARWLSLLDTEDYSTSMNYRLFGWGHCLPINSTSIFQQRAWVFEHWRLSCISACIYLAVLDSMKWPFNGRARKSVSGDSNREQMMLPAPPSTWKTNDVANMEGQENKTINDCIYLLR